ncbi:diacylglycerol kinase family lipid kinase [uncultured Acetobacteroides sp.]|uniref:diacylglycerol/lipid kinase family protein n=1 Tax=uncultured Acetobacteroides sp. TaxID=1760811 RepID=UPI0029F4698C|nr:diacylglycerol kinase family lipid kinase [uncultured Acetobacteroides sp.]
MANGKWFAIVNPKAGKGRAVVDWPRISWMLTDAGVEFDHVFTQKKYHAVELTVRAIRSGYRKIISVGGDGTLNEIVNGIFIQKEVATTDVLLAMMPLGIGNDWIRMYGIPRTYADAIDAIKFGRSFLQDVGLVKFYEAKVHHERYFANAVGIGFDGYVAIGFNRLKEAGKKSKWLYVISMIKSVLTYKASKVAMRIDGDPISDEIYSITLGVGKYNGGGMIQMPNAIANDGLLDVTIIRKISGLNVLWNMPILYNGHIHRHSRITGHRGSDIAIHSIPQIPIEVDGESVGYSPFDISVVAKGINVIVGRDFNEME